MSLTPKKNTAGRPHRERSTCAPHRSRTVAAFEARVSLIRGIVPVRQLHRPQSQESKALHAGRNGVGHAQTIDSRSGRSQSSDARHSLAMAGEPGLPAALGVLFRSPFAMDRPLLPGERNRISSVCSAPSSLSGDLSRPQGEIRCVFITFCVLESCCLGRRLLALPLGNSRLRPKRS